MHAPRTLSQTLVALSLALAAGCAVDEPATNTGATSGGDSPGGSNDNAGKGPGGASDSGSWTGADPQDPGASIDNGGTGGGNTGGAIGGSPGEGSGSGSDSAGGGSYDAGQGAPPPAQDAGSTAYDTTQPEDTGPDTSAGECNTTDPVVLYLSADDSNSMAGATIARGLIAQGQYVTKAVRTYEMLNYYDFAYPAAEPGHVAVSAQLSESGDDGYSLQIGVRAPDFDDTTRRRLNVVLAVDTSSSMGWGTAGTRGIDRAHEACVALVGSLGEGDVFSLLTWGDEPSVFVDSHELTGPDDGTLGASCGELVAKGRTDLSGGLKAAYALAKEGFADDRINRVLLISDGGANVGETDEKLIAEAAKDANGEAIYLMGIGVGDPWNYNDTLMNAVTDAGKGAYIFLDDGLEASAVFGAGFLRHVEVAARDVQVQLTLPPTFGMKAFHGEQVSTDPEEVEPQHLAANDAMIFHQVIASCDPTALTGDEAVTVKATWEDPITREQVVDTFEASFTALLESDDALLLKGDAVVAYAEALQDTQSLTGTAAQGRIDEGIAAIEAGIAALTGDADLQELLTLLLAYRAVFKTGQTDRYPIGGTGAKAIDLDCGSCKATGDSLEAMACALDICGPGVLLEQSYVSTTGATTDGTHTAMSQFGSATNDLGPKVGGSYAVMGTGPVKGTSHSQAMGGTSGSDPFVKGSAAIYDAMEWTLVLKAPEGANGIRIRSVYFSEEYDDYVGSSYNDKLYMVLQAGSTNGGTPTVINQTECRDPEIYHDVVCSPGMQFCNPRQPYCYVAINTALSECCWLGGCPDGKATTDISGTGFSCAEQNQDSDAHGSSTGWLMTEWPIEPGETFTLTFHLHDTGDGIYDSAAILDGLQFVGSVTPGTWRIQ